MNCVKVIVYIVRKYSKLFELLVNSGDGVFGPPNGSHTGLKHFDVLPTLRRVSAQEALTRHGLQLKSCQYPFSIQINYIIYLLFF